MIMRDKGFTLIELLISTAILGFMIAGMTLALLQQQRQFNITKEAVDVDQTGRSVLDYIASEVRNASSRQGKNFSLTFINGGRENCNTNTADAGSADSPPDCLSIFTWDISRGMNPDPDPGENRLPSIAKEVQVNSSAGNLVIDLPNEWFESSGKLIGETESNQEIMVGFRSRANLCNPNQSIDCLGNPELCTECAVILEGQVNDSAKTITFDSADDIVKTNFPVSFGSIGEFITGKTSANGNTYGFVNSISSQYSEMSIVQSKAFRVNPVQRELEMSTNGGPFQPIAGGSTAETPEQLDAPGIVDLQFVFNLQNQDGTITKVGFCDTSTCPCDTTPSPPPAIQSDFSCGAVAGRQSDIRSVEIYLVVKSKIKPRKMSGGAFEQEIPQLGDVLERTVDTPSDFLEPESGFIYRIHSTTVYPRNMAREDFG